LRPDDLLAKSLVAIIGSMLLFKASEVVVYWFESQVFSKYTVLVQNGSFLVFAVIKIVLILINAPLIVFALATMAESLTVALLLGAVIGLRGPRLQHLRISLVLAKSLIKDAWPLLLTNFAIMAYMRIDQIMLGQMVGSEAVGIYTAAVRISEVWYFIPMIIVASVFPAILNAKKKSEIEYTKKIQLLYDGLCLFSILLSSFIWLGSNWFIDTLFGASFENASDVLKIHAWNTVLVALGVARSKWLVSENLQKFGFYYIAISLVVNIIGNYVFIPQFGAVGAAWTTLFSTLTATVIAPYVFKETRQSAIMLLRSFKIWRLPLRLLGKI
jgi:PST family polysaccharide transporter